MSDHSMADLLGQDTSKATRFAGVPDGLYERHLVFDHVIDSAPGHPPRALRGRRPRPPRPAVAALAPDAAGLRPRQPQARLLPVDGVPHRPVAHEQHHQPAWSTRSSAGGRQTAGVDMAEIVEEEPDAGLGNGGLGRLAACFIDSMATLADPRHRLRPALRVRHLPPGDQERLPGRGAGQLAPPRPTPGRSPGPAAAVEMRLNSGVQIRERRHQGPHRPAAPRSSASPTTAPSSATAARPSTRCGSGAPARPDFFDLDEFNSGDFIGAVHDKVAAEALTRVLYPDDSTDTGKGLRFLQEYFLVACSLADILARFRRHNSDWRTLPDKVAIQLNDTHPAMAVAELMRILLDEVAPRLGRGVGPHPADARLHEPHPAARGAREVAGPPLRVVPAAAARDHLRDQPPLPRRGAPEVPRRRRPRRSG